MRKVTLVILDGWGVSEETAGNAIKNAKTPNMDKLLAYYPSTNLQASGISVGLPYEKMGNSEVGHLTIGSGKILYQNLIRVTLAIQDRSFFNDRALLSAIENVKVNNSNLHLMGLVSDGGVHSHVDHIYALLEMFKEKGVNPEKVFIHAFTDGRDTAPESGVDFIRDLEKNIKNEHFPGRIASLMGRYYAMDRNENWDRTKKAYYAMVNGVGKTSNDAATALEESYKQKITDEFIEPVLIEDKNGELATIKPADSLIFFNIREDRARQITKAFCLDNFDYFDRGSKVPNIDLTTMFEYEKGLPVNVVFPPEEVESPLGKVLSDSGVKQLRIAETEKYAHVTYFFNGGKEEPFENEFRALVPSPNVNDYVDTPKMSAEGIADQVVDSIQKGTYDFILVNFANPDMIGHTGNINAAIKAVEYTDECLGRIYEAIMANNSVLLVTADHGNAEEMMDFRTGKSITEHSSNPVPFIVVDPEKQFDSPKTNPEYTIGGMLSDIAPTVLDIMEIEKPEEMTGMSLLDSVE